MKWHWPGSGGRNAPCPPDQGWKDTVQTVPQPLAWSSVHHGGLQPARNRTQVVLITTGRQKASGVLGSTARHL